MRSIVTRKFHRTVTNVSPHSSTYKAIVKAAVGMTVKVTPSVLSFKSSGEMKSFVVQVRANLKKRKMLSGSLIWDDGSHKVRSPIVAHVPPPPCSYDGGVWSRTSRVAN
ncbi:hypothetical protein ACFE04_029406 [Oxalis oulophora]